MAPKKGKSNHSVVQKTKDKRTTFRRRTMKFHSEKKWNRDIDYNEALKRRPKRQEWLRAIKGLLGSTPEDQGWTFYYEVVKYNPMLRIWRNEEGELIRNKVRFGEKREDWSMEAVGMEGAVEVAIPETIQRVREYLLELKYLLRHDGYNLEANQFELEEWDRTEDNEQLTLGFEDFAALARFKRD